MKDFIDSMRLRWSKSRRILIVASDNVDIWGGVLAKRNGQLSLLCYACNSLHAEDSLIAGESGLNVLLLHLETQLKTAGMGLLPKEVHFLSSDVMSILVGLPTSEFDPKDKEGLGKLFQWELEPTIARQQALWRIGEVFVARRWLDSAQLNELIETQAKEKVEGEQSTAFGQLATSAGWIDEKQLEQALSFQQSMRLDEDSLSCAWLSIDARPNSRNNDTELRGTGDDIQSALACAVNPRRLEYWRNEFRRADIELASIHPLSGACPEIDSIEDTLAIELYHGAVSCARYEQGKLKHLHLDYGFDQDCLTQCLNLLSEVELNNEINIEVRGNNTDIAEHAEALAIHLQKPMRIAYSNVLESNDLDYVTHARYHNVVALATHLLQPKQAFEYLTIDTQVALAPKSQRIAFWWQVASFALISMIVATESYYNFKLLRVETKGDLAKASLQDQEETVELLNRAIQANQKQLDEERHVRNELEALQARYDLFFNAQPSRQEFLISLFPMLANAAPRKVVLNRVSESESGLNVIGWAFDDVAAQRFISQLAKPVSEQDLYITDTQISPQPGPFNRVGQRFSFNLVSSVNTGARGISEGKREI